MKIYNSNDEEADHSSADDTAGGDVQQSSSKMKRTVIKIVLMGMTLVGLLTERTLKQSMVDIRSLSCIHGATVGALGRRLLCSVETALVNTESGGNNESGGISNGAIAGSVLENAFPEPVNDYTADWSVAQPSGTVAFVVTIPSCPEDAAHPTARDDAGAGAFYDAAAVLQESICNCTALSPESGSTVQPTLYAIIHPSAITCLGPSGTADYDRVAILEELGYWVKIWREPVRLSQFPQNSYVRNNINAGGGDGIRSFLRLYAYNITSHPVAFLMDFDTVFTANVDPVVTALQNDDNAISSYELLSDDATVNAGTIVLKPNEAEYNAMIQTLLTTDYTASSGWHTTGMFGLGAQGFLSYYLMTGDSTKHVSRTTSAANTVIADGIITSFQKNYNCQQPWDCHHDDTWSTQTEDDCRALNDAWYSHRQAFEEKWSKTELVDTTKNNFHNDMFHGYCSGEGGYNDAATYQAL